MKCYYEKIECSELNTSGMTKIGCEKCKHYGDGVRLTGAMPSVDYIFNKLKVIYNTTKDVQR